MIGILRTIGFIIFIALIIFITALHGDVNEVKHKPDYALYNLTTVNGDESRVSIKNIEVLQDFLKDQRNKSKLLVQNNTSLGRISIVETMFIVGDIRYTIEFVQNNGYPESMYFRTNPKESSDIKKMQSWTDDTANGNVEYAVNGSVDGVDVITKFYSCDKDTGMEYRKYWNEKYKSSMKEIFQNFNLEWTN